MRSEQGTMTILGLPRFFLALVFAASVAMAQEAPPLNDGPTLTHLSDGAVLARWVEAGEVQSKMFAKGAPVTLPRFAKIMGSFVPTATHQARPAVHAMPERLLAISDVEGEYDRLRAFLLKHGVIDAKGAWAFGRGQVVCVGDFVDRGEKVTEVLWLMHRLDRESRAAGGALHFLIGNHEAMVMAGDVRYTHPKYAQVGRLLGRTSPRLYGPDTELGRWLRSCNTIVRIGEILFVHAGISPGVAASGWSLDDINAKIRSSLGKSPREISDEDARWLATDRQGPLWYRGYFSRFRASFGPRPDDLALNGILRRLKAKSIVIGHTKVRELSEVYSDRRVIDIDTTWTSDEKVRGLLFREARTEALALDGSRRPFGAKRPEEAIK